MTTWSHERMDQGGFRPPWFTLVLAGAVTLLYLILGPAPAALVLDRGLLAQGEIWRLATGHLVHSDPAHLLWNLAAFVPLGVLLETRVGVSPWRFAGLLAASACAVDAWVLLAEPGLSLYCGLSGVLNGLFAAVAFALWRERRHPAFLLALAGDITKIAIEMVTGESLLTATAWAPVPGAHLAGLAAGLLYIIGMDLALRPMQPLEGTAGVE